MWLYLLLIIVFLLAFFLRNFIRLVIIAFKLPGPKVVSVLGNVLLINDSKRLIYYGNNAQKLYGSLFRVWISFVPVIFVYEAQHLKLILSSSKLSEKNLFYTLLHNVIGNGLISSTGYAWKKNRKLIQPCFTINELKSFIEYFHNGGKELLRQLEEDKDVKIGHLINHTILNILRESVLGLSSAVDTPFRNGNISFTYRLTKPWLMFESLFQLTSKAEKEVEQTLCLSDFTREFLKQRLEERKKTDKPRVKKCLLDNLIDISENNPEFTHEDIINETSTFMLAAQDSVASATVFALYSLAKYQDIQRNVVNEMKKVFTKNNLDEITIEELNQMKYLEMCIKETLRLYPSLPIISRVLNEDIKLDEHMIPAGTNVVISVYTAHRLPSSFPDPFKFNPERFRDNNYPYAFLPFSAGPRNCIGYKYAMLELKTLICTILDKYELFLSPGKEEIQLMYNVTLRAKGGVWLRCKKRNL